MEPCQTVTLQGSNSGDVGTSKDSEKKCQRDGEAAPLKIADNTKDLNIDLNSADDVRQAMKVLLGGTVHPNYNEDDSTVSKNKLKLTNPLNMKNIQITEADLPQGAKLPPNTTLKRGPKAKGGPTKKRTRRIYNEREEIDRMYIGKLSNVVPFQSNLRYKIRFDCESDIDSELYSSS